MIDLHCASDLTLLRRAVPQFLTFARAAAINDTTAGRRAGPRPTAGPHDIIWGDTND
ncbi:hypothetical protein [Loktanella salsilacus]|uniref:hypothetical protein n=1 Tax=Loktanella salsilacus TaxID=195913 RepID=UPI00373615B6